MVTQQEVDEWGIDFPPLEKVVIVTMDDGVEFKAMRVLVDGDDGRSCETWITANEFEPSCPECWDDGMCWASNSSCVPSRQPVAWRDI